MHFGENIISNKKSTERAQTSAKQRIIWISTQKLTLPTAKQSHNLTGEATQEPESSLSQQGPKKTVFTTIISREEKYLMLPNDRVLVG